MKTLARHAVPAGTCWFAIHAIAITGLVPLSASAQNEEVDTLIVTARKREEALQEVPVAVTAFSEEALANRQIQSIDDFARFTPGLSFSKAFGRATERPVIRGLGNVLAGVQFGVESGAAYFVDGVYYPGDLQSLNLSEVERVEVIRGPQSALYGRNTYSGAINYVTRAPQDFESTAKLRFGEDGDAELGYRVAGPLIDGVLAGSLNARYYSFDGEYTNIVTGKKVGDEESRSVSGVLDWTPAADLRVRTRVNLQRDDDGTRAFFLQPSESNNCFPGTRSNASWAITGSTNNNQYYCGEIKRPADWVALNDGPALPGQPAPIPGIPDVPFPGNVVFGTPGGDPYNPAQGVAFSGVERDLFYSSILAEWDIGGSGYVLSAALAYRDDDLTTGSDSDHSAVNFIAGNPPANSSECTLCASEIDDARDYSAELRLQSPQDTRLRWMLGGFLYDQEIDGRDIFFTDSTRSGTASGGVIEEQGVENWALFGSVEFDIWDTLTATVEGRYFDEEKELMQTTGGGFDENADFDEFAPRVTLNWQATPDVLLYGIYAKGYKPGGLNGTLGASVGTPSYDQEESDNYEIGMKSGWFDGRLIANIALFYIEVDAIQLTTALSTGTGTLTSIVTNQGSGDVTGAELELSYQLTDEITVGANYALADTEFDKGCDEFQWTLTSGGGNLTDAAACTGNNVNGNGNGSIKGNQFPLSSKNQFSAYVDYRRPMDNGWELFAGSDVSWEDEKPVQVHNLAWVPEATILNARIGIDTGRLSLALYGRNLTDEDAPAMATRWLQDPLLITAAGFPSVAGAGVAPALCAPGTGGCSTSFPRAFFGDMRRGRNVGVELTYRFGDDD
jgi:outer membrane receptor protein involved in Fe transport